MLDDAFVDVMRPSVPAPSTIPTPARAPQAYRRKRKTRIDQRIDPAPVEDPDGPSSATS